MTKSINKPVDRAQPVIRKSKGTDAAKVGIARSLVGTMQASPEWNSAVAVQDAAKLLTKAADAIESNAKVALDLRGKLGAAEATQRTLRRDWSIAMQQLTALVAIFCEGSSDRVHAFGFDVRQHSSSGAAHAPSGVTSSPGAISGTVTFQWSRGNARRGFVVQHASDVANPATYSQVVPCTKAKYTLAGAPPASTVYFRVASIDSKAASGQGPWSDWTAGSVR